MTTLRMSAWIGYDPREAAAFAVARHSIRSFDRHIPVHGLVLSELQARGMYYRATERRLGKLWDTISQAPMSTEFAISRFLVPALEKKQNGSRFATWALFMDCDMMVLSNLEHLRVLLDDSKAIMCVKHEHVPQSNEKMDGQVQTSYPRKNWSSMMAFNVDHPANDALTVEMVNTLPGRDLHRFCWLDDSEIGELPKEWNWLEGYSDPSIDAKVVHLTRGGPWMAGWDQVAFAETWCKELRIARSQHHHAPRGQDPFVPHRNEMI